MRLRIFDRESVFEEAFGEAMTANDSARALTSRRRELHFSVLQLHQMKLGHTRENAAGGLVADHRKASGGTCGLQPIGLRWFPLFTADPNLFEQMIEANLIIGRSWRAAIVGIG